MSTPGGAQVRSSPKPSIGYDKNFTAADELKLREEVAVRTHCNISLIKPLDIGGTKCNSYLVTCPYNGREIVIKAMKKFNFEAVKKAKRKELRNMLLVRGKTSFVQIVDLPPRSYLREEEGYAYNIAVQFDGFSGEYFEADKYAGDILIKCGDYFIWGFAMKKYSSLCKLGGMEFNKVAREWINEYGIDYVAKNIAFTVTEAFTEMREEHPDFVFSDLKGANLLYDSNYTYPKIVIGDLGSAHLQEEGGPTGGIEDGTIEYEDPALKNRGTKKIPETADLFSLGVILWKLYHTDLNTLKAAFFYYNAKEIEEYPLDMQENRRRWMSGEADVEMPSGMDTTMAYIIKKLLKYNLEERPFTSGEMLLSYMHGYFGYMKPNHIKSQPVSQVRAQPYRPEPSQEQKAAQLNPRDMTAAGYSRTPSQQGQKPVRSDSHPRPLDEKSPAKKTAGNTANTPVSKKKKKKKKKKVFPVVLIFLLVFALTFGALYFIVPMLAENNSAPGYVTVKNYVGTELEKAEKSLTRSGCTYSVEMYDDYYGAKTYVYDQSIDEGETVAEGTEIVLYAVECDSESDFSDLYGRLTSGEEEPGFIDRVRSSVEDFFVGLHEAGSEKFSDIGSVREAIEEEISEDINGAKKSIYHFWNKIKP